MISEFIVQAGTGRLCHTLIFATLCDIRRRKEQKKRLQSIHKYTSISVNVNIQYFRKLNHRGRNTNSQRKVNSWSGFLNSNAYKSQIKMNSWSGFLNSNAYKNKTQTTFLFTRASLFSHVTLSGLRTIFGLFFIRFVKRS